MVEVSLLEGIWFTLWVLLWAVYFVLDGFDLGMGTLMPFIAKNDSERRVIYNAAGPFWDGNEVWLITAGGVTFAAFPKAYAVMFSALYAPLLILLFCLIFRAVSFEFRNKIQHTKWVGLWDTCQFLGSLLPALLLGVAFGNLFQGIPIDGDGVYHGNILKLLNPYGLLTGVLFVLMFMHHGVLWLSIKSVGELHERAIRWSRTIWIYLLAVAIVFLVATHLYTSIYDNILKWPYLAAFPLAAVVLLLASRCAKAGNWSAWFLSAGFIICATFFGVFGIFPGMILSSINPEYSVTVMKAASSPLTLKIMLIVTLCFVPVVIAYQAWAYVIFRHKITPEDLKKENAY